MKFFKNLIKDDPERDLHVVTFVMGFALIITTVLYVTAMN